MTEVTKIKAGPGGGETAGRKGRGQTMTQQEKYIQWCREQLSERMKILEIKLDKKGQDFLLAAEILHMVESDKTNTNVKYFTDYEIGIIKNARSTMTDIRRLKKVLALMTLDYSAWLGRLY